MTDFMFFVFTKILRIDLKVPHGIPLGTQLFFYLDIFVDGAAARLACPGNLIIVCSYVILDQKELPTYEQVLIYFNEKNEIIRSASSIPVQSACNFIRSSPLSVGRQTVQF
ncbi:aspartate 1-decarboxylase [Methyloglobulus sp.]|uniref:aspartate 1-decarboxylase n=1 Tax=Methyloglobulus sp. TaxID=2518622 RepID=UPI003989A166